MRSSAQVAVASNVAVVALARSGATIPYPTRSNAALPPYPIGDRCARESSARSISRRAFAVVVPILRASQQSAAETRRQRACERRHLQAADADADVLVDVVGVEQRPVSVVGVSRLVPIGEVRQPSNLRQLLLLPSRLFPAAGIPSGV